MQVCEELLEHLGMQRRCRQRYWEARERSRKHDDLLCMIIDGFDKSKPVVPRWTSGRPPKGGVFERVRRPGLSIACVLAHGFAVHIFVASEETPDNSSWTWECLSRALQATHEHCCKQNWRFPSQLWIQGDNTVRELKNQQSALCSAMLLSAGCFRQVGVHHLPIGHTHEDVGRCAAIRRFG
ncbi:unnamed protein product [Symbiodinium sp. CCMP2592]|nr:unnamed protein product [Symbiodinium sp. CCMP2592]